MSNIPKSEAASKKEQWDKTFFQRHRVAKEMHEQLMDKGEILVRVREDAPRHQQPEYSCNLVKVFTVKLRGGGVEGFGIFELGSDRPTGGYMTTTKEEMLLWFSDLQPARGKVVTV